MRRVGRRRTANQHLPLGVRPIGNSLFWQPPKAPERLERKKQGLPASEPLGPIVRVRGRIELTKQQRLKWAEISGYRDPKDLEGTVDELLTRFETEGLEKQPNGRPRAKNTIKHYARQIPVLREKFGNSRYGKTEFEASRSQAIGTAQIQFYINESGSYASQRLAVLSNAFNQGIREGRTTYNPCDKVIPQSQAPRERAPLEWEVEVLGTLGRPVIELILGFSNISGWRISKIIGLQRKHLHADGIRPVPDKGGKPDVWDYSPECNRIIAAAEALPRASRFPAAPLFPNSHGRAFSYAAFYNAWRSLLEETNQALAAGVVDVDTLEGGGPGLVIEDLHIHDVRSKVHDDAEAMGREGHEQLGNTERVADRHYARREKRRQMLR